MKSHSNSTAQTVIVALTVLTFFCCSLAVYGDIEFRGGVTAEIDYFVDGHVWIYDASVAMVDPAHISGAVVTGSEAVLDVYGGQIDSMLLISTNDLSLPEGIVTVYGTDFAVDGVPVDPEITELFLQYQTLSGVYENGTPFAFPVDCIIAGGGDFLYYQTVKLGWIVNQPNIELSQSEYNLGQVDVGTTQTQTVPIFNLGNASLTIQSLQIEQSQQNQFAFIPWQTLPAALEPNSFIDLEVLFSPAIDGIDTAVLSILSDDPNDPVVDVVLTGEGVPVVLSSEEQITNVLDVYEGALEDASIQGVGNGNSAANKTETFGKMLQLAEGLIDAGLYDYAIETLQIIESKCDGQGSPKDFIGGDGATELNALINELIDALQQ